MSDALGVRWTPDSLNDARGVMSRAQAGAGTGAEARSSTRATASEAKASTRATARLKPGYCEDETWQAWLTMGASESRHAGTSAPRWL